MLGYDPRNPLVCQLEFVADIGKVGERVDYAILKDGQPFLLIEAKTANSIARGQAPPMQLRRYFVSTPANLGVLTDGLTWNWYRANPTHPKLEEAPFLSHDVRHPGDIEIAWLQQINPTPDTTDEQTNSHSDEQEALQTAKVIFTGNFGGLKGYLNGPTILTLILFTSAALIAAGNGAIVVAIIATPPLMLYWTWKTLHHFFTHLEITTDRSSHPTATDSIPRSYNKP